MTPCKKCSTEKPADQYYANDRTCKECRKAAVRKNRAEKVDYYREYDRIRFKEDPKVRERNKRYQQTEAGKISIEKSRKKYSDSVSGKIVLSESRKKWYEEHKVMVYERTLEYRNEFPKKYAAHNAVHCAKIKGDLVPQPCEICGKESRTHAHHDDYDKKLDVRWLCSRHHRLWHSEHGEAANAK